jgi:hypothetical protein
MFQKNKVIYIILDPSTDCLTDREDKYIGVFLKRGYVINQQKCSGSSL